MKMKNIKSRATLSYAYNLGDVVVRNVTNSNFVQPEYREVAIKVRKFANVEYYKPGDIITYTLVLTNVGTYEANNVTIREDLPYQVLIKESIKLRNLNEQSFVFKDDLNSVNFVLDHFAPNNTIYITYQTIVDEIVDINYNITTSAQLTIDDEVVLNSNPVAISLKYARLVCEKKTVEVIYPNKSFEYLITIENIGNEKAVDLEISDQLPESYVLENILIDDVPCLNYAIDNTTLKFSVGEVNQFKSIVVKIIGMIKRSE
jgi:uncharacterized repeat protein (TIGR01451 family)